MSQIKKPVGDDGRGIEMKSIVGIFERKKMKKQDKNRLSKKDRRLIKKAMLKAAAKGCDEVYRIALGLKDAFELLGRKDG